MVVKLTWYGTGGHVFGGRGGVSVVGWMVGSTIVSKNAEAEPTHITHPASIPMSHSAKPEYVRSLKTIKKPIQCMS